MDAEDNQEISTVFGNIVRYECFRVFKKVRVIAGSGKVSPENCFRPDFICTGYREKSADRDGINDLFAKRTRTGKKLSWHFIHKLPAFPKAIDTVRSVGIGPDGFRKI